MSTTRLNINLNEETAAALRAFAAADGTTVTEEVRRAVSVYKFVKDAVKQGRGLCLHERDGGHTSVEFL